KISFESYDPELSAQVANTMAEVYIASNLEARQNISSKSSSWLSERLSGLLEKLKISESRLQDYRERHHLVDVQGVNSIASKQLNELTTSLMQAQRERNEKRQLYEMVDRANKSMSALLAIPAILNSPVIQELQKLEATKEREMADLVQRYGPEHPRMISAKSDLSSARNNLQKQALMLADAIVQDYRIAASNASGVEQRFESVKKELQQINREEAELDVLQREVATNRQLYNLFLTRTKETDATGTVQANDIQALNARVIDPAIAPMAPNKPNKKQIVLFTALTTLVIAVLLALLSENMNDYIRSTDDIEQKLKLPCLGTVPLVVDKRWKKEAVTMGQLFINQDHSPFFESIRTVRAALILSEQERKFRVIAITSTVPREGKSTISANLSLAMSPMEKVLLIDGDLRRPSIAKIFGIDKDSPGLSNLINGTQPQSACLHDIPGTNLTVMPSGDQPPNPHVLLSSKVFQDLLKQLSERFDRVIIDTPPTHAVADSLIIGAIADANICVCHAESTPFPMIHTSIAHMRRTNVPIVGVVLNQFKSKRRHGYYYSSYYSYGGYNYSKKSGGTKGS
ncbi:MAG TPA: polysaccharide biosynthesis tyrosine autokinase, partial [Magnetococcales bacterium]|nr:polysaccharide biosynthesis tyrosine autokinase [Magnetococcales bacterium]